MYRIFLSAKDTLNIQVLRDIACTFLLAKNESKEVILRLDDRLKDTSTLHEVLNFLTFKFDRIYKSSDNLKFYRQFASKLLQEKKAFCCFCENKTCNCKNLSDEEILSNQSPCQVRLFYKDDDFVILDKNKQPKEDFLNSIDDMLQGVSFVVKSKKCLKNTKKENFIREALGYFEAIKFIFFPDISKTNNLNIISLLEEGFLPESLINFVLLSSFEFEKEIFSSDEATKLLKTKDIKNFFDFDIKKLRSINIEHINNLHDERLSEMLGFNGAYMGSLAKVFLNESATLMELKETINKLVYETNGIKKYLHEYEIIKKELIGAKKFKNFAQLIKHLEKITNIKEKDLLEVLSAIVINARKQEKDKSIKGDKK